MKTILEFEVEEYEKMLSALDLPVEDEDKSQYFNAWNLVKQLESILPQMNQ